MKKTLKVEIKEGFKKDFESETQKLQEEIKQVKEQQAKAIAENQKIQQQ